MIMINLVCFLINLPKITTQSYKVKLHGSNPLYMDCSDIEEGNNGFYGKQYFYDSLSKQGTYTNLDKFTFYLWFNIHSTMILSGKQVLFSFVDGYDSDSALNLMVYYQKDKQNQYYFAVLNDKLIPEKKKLYINQINDLFMGSWNYFAISIDQTSGNVLINLKFFSTYNQKSQQKTDVFPQQKFIYTFGPHSRITNEQLYEQTQDYKACVNIANFYYINGWAAMDSEIYVDYVLDLKFLLRPYSTSLSSDTAQLILSSDGVEFSGQVGINVYKSTQLVYNFIEQMSSFTIGFWMKTANIASDFQILSLTDDSIEETSIGFGADKDQNLLLYQSYSSKKIGTIQDQQWQHITAGLLEISLDEKFAQTNLKKFLRVFMDNQEIFNDFILNLLTYKRLLIGPTKLDNKGLEVVDIQDIKIFNGFGIVASNTDCLLFVGEYCLFCKIGTHYCSEQNPLDDTLVYDCPAGQKTTSTGCQLIQHSNCLRVSSTQCLVCMDGYQLNNGNCQSIASYIFVPYTCSDTNALFCEQYVVNNIQVTTTTEIVQNKMQISRLCQQLQNQYDPVTYTCSQNEVPNCEQAQYLQSCFKCQVGYYVTSQKKCAQNCAQNGILRFRDSDTTNNLCIQSCPNRYLFSYTCVLQKDQKGIMDYWCDSRKTCASGELDLKYTCLTQNQSQIGFGKICSVFFSKIYYSTIKCKPICKYCYGTQINHCLGCYNGYYFSPYLTTCLKKCSDQSNRFLYHNPDKKMCEYECPSNLFYQEDYCVSQCSVGYSKFQNKCIRITTVEYYLDTKLQKMNLCPNLCLTCTSSTTCQQCINDYPFYNNQCLFSCYPQVLTQDAFDTFICKSSCDPDDLVYDNPDFLGYSIKQCFQYTCGSIQAGGLFQTFRHQTDPQICSLPCEDGYYGDLNSLQCQQCADQCSKCENLDYFCTECYPSTFLWNNDCFDNCGNKYTNYITFECEGTCSSGVRLNDKVQGIKACVAKCGQIFADYKYNWNDNCLKTQPTQLAYCIGYNCYNCNSLCKSCSGPLNTNCTACFDNHFLNNNTCVTDCGLLKYDKINWRCVSICPSYLFQSSGLEPINNVIKTITTCYITCLYQKYQFIDQCYDLKPNNCYCQQRANYIFCDKCSQQCLQCTSATSSSCSQCSPKSFLLNTTCYYDCPNEAPFQDLATSQCVIKCDNFSKEGKCVLQCDVNDFVNLANKVCYSSGCPIGQYNQISTKYCYACYEGCSSCLDGTNNSCQSCFDGYFLNQGTLSCTKQCLTDPYLIQDQIKGLCVQSCQVGTFLQSNPDGSLACREVCPVYIYSNICVTQCPIQTYLDVAKCLNCAGPCSVCFGTEINQCTQCDQGYYRDGTTCYQNCPLQKPYINIQDQTCIQNCLDYLYLSQMICFIQCPLFLFKYELNGKKECVEQCYIKSYLLNGSCYDCNPLCQYCFGPNNGNCIQCEKPYYLYQQTCQLTCPLFYDTEVYECKDACPVNLVAQNQYCQLQCNPGFFVYNQICLAACPKFTFRKGVECYDCNFECLTCYGPSENECNSCIDGYYLNGYSCQQNCDNFYDVELKQCKNDCQGKLEIVDQKKCVSTCPSFYIQCQTQCLQNAPDGYYSDGTKCQKCNDKCTKCVSQSSCSECKANFYLDRDQCDNYCSNKYMFMDISSKTCVTKCPSQLFHLESFDKRFCVVDCNFKLNDWCVSACPKGMYSDNSICKDCSHACLECEKFEFCQICQSNYFNENGICLTTCLLSKSDRVNIKCVTECDKSLYTYQEECLSQCPTNPLTYQYKMTCYDQCPNGTYLNDQKCQDCDKSCLQCIGPSNNDCLSCVASYYLENQICTKTCNQLYDQINFQCVIVCPENSFQELNNCVAKCSNYQYKNQCIDNCPANTYISNYQCFECSENCVQCDSFGCLKCQTSTYLLNGVCESTCPIFYDNTKNECVDMCPNQTVKFFDNCYNECPLNTFELLQECELSCPRYMVVKDNKCVSCPERCSECLDDTVCTICLDNYHLYKGQCYISCPLAMPYAHLSLGICLNECTPDTFISGFNCVTSCSSITYQNKCLDKCPSGYYGSDTCKPCRLECKECINYDFCTVCNNNYFLEQNQCDTQCTNIKDLTSQQCVNTCDKLLYKNVCYQQCPFNTFEFENICVVNCNDGYYGSDQLKCEKCPNECKLCSNKTQCSKCKVGFYLSQTNCLQECPLSLFADPIQNECLTQCPKKTYVLENQCLFDCPDGYYRDDTNFKCIENCSNQQYLENKTCFQCSIECDGCYASGNNYCVKCQTNFKLDENGYCVGTECKTGYFLQNQSCQKCQHKCLSCQNELECTKCKGTNRISSDCSCQKGYYDDEFYNDCQKCPCDECTSQTNCLTCKNNLQSPLCTCDRVLNKDWCISCVIAKVNIYFSDDLNQIIVYFGYLVTANLLNPFQPSSCQQWFDNSEDFGKNATCYLSWDRYSIVIQLKPYSTIQVGDELTFKENFYRDIDQGTCDNFFIQKFIENKVHGPTQLQKPYVLFTAPSFVSACKVVEINQILLDGTGQRLQKVLSWQLEQMDNEDAYLLMDAFLVQQNNEITIPMGILSPNTTYIITAKYINMFERVNYTLFSFTTLPKQTPYVYLSFNPLKANVYVFDCHITFQDMKNQFNIQIDVIDFKNNSNVYISQNEEINQIYEISLNESILPKQQPLYFVATTASIIIKELFVLQSKEIDVQFLYPDRFIGQDNKIKARGYDRNIQDEVLSTKNINYDWLCTNLNNLQPCKTEENQIIHFPSSRVIDIFANVQNITLAFYVKTSIDKRWTTKEQYIVITNFNIEMEFVLNQKSSKNYINPNDEVTILIKNNQKYAFIMQDFKVLSSQKIVGERIKFRLADFLINSTSPVQIYLLPGQESISFQINHPPEKVIFEVTPLKGKSLEYFNYTIKNLGQGSKSSIFYYFSNSKMTSDVLNQQSINGIPLIINSQTNEGSFQLPNGLSESKIFLLCVIETDFGTKSFLNQSVDVESQNYKLTDYTQAFNKQINFSDLNSLHLIAVSMQLEQQSVCLKQCSGVGTCVNNNKCECPPGYYFDDCSGNEKDYQSYLDIIKTSISNLIQLNISNNENFKQFSQSLLFFSQFSDLIQSLTLEQCESILHQYVSNTNIRLVQINQYTLNLQYQATQDYNYSEIDIRSIVNQNDLQVALDSMVFMWNKTLFSQDSSTYLLQNYMKQFISNVIDLSFATLGYEAEIFYQIDTAEIHILKTTNLTKFVNFTDSYNSRILTEGQSNYDIVLSVYLRNFYAYDGYFPYPDQIYPLYDYQIRYSNKKENIKLENKISYKFKVLNISSNLVCLTRNQTTYFWTDEYCEFDQIDQIYFCNCSILAPTTIVNDLKYAYQGDPPNKIILPNVLLVVYGIQVVLVMAFALKSNAAVSQNQLVTPSENFKYGKVRGLMKKRGIFAFGGSSSDQPQQEDNSKRVVRYENSEVEKFQSFNQFWKRHFLFRLVLKQPQYLSQFFRWVLIIIRYNIELIIAEILYLYWDENQILIYVLVLIGSIIFVRSFENFIQKQIKRSYILQYSILLFIQKFLIILMLVFSLLILIFFYFKLEDQTIIIISYSIASASDLFLLDALFFTLNKFLGESEKQIIKEKIKLFSKIKEIQLTE